MRVPYFYIMIYYLMARALLLGGTYAIDPEQIKPDICKILKKYLF